MNIGTVPQPNFGNNRSRPVVIIHLSASTRFWRWQARQQGKVIASQSGDISCSRSFTYWQRFAELKAQSWMLENNVTDAPVIHEEVTR